MVFLNGLIINNQLSSLHVFKTWNDAILIITNIIRPWWPKTQSFPKCPSLHYGGQLRTSYFEGDFKTRILWKLQIRFIFCFIFEKPQLQNFQIIKIIPEIFIFILRNWPSKPTFWKPCGTEWTLILTVYFWTIFSVAHIEYMYIFEMCKIFSNAKSDVKITWFKVMKPK